MITHNGQDVKGMMGKYATHRKQSLLLASVYEHLYNMAELAADLDRWEDRVQKCKCCGTQLQFDVYRNSAGDTRHVLAGANFCRLLLCPMCQWRRAQKLYSDMLRCWQYVFDDYRQIEFDTSKHRLRPRLRAILLTLTVPNVPGDQLRDKILAMSDGWHRLVKAKEFRAIHGYYKCLEVTYNFAADTYHPHYHVLCLVDEDYFKAGYVDQPTWLALWRRCMGDDDIMQVDVRALRGSTPKAMLRNLNETCKYTVKATDFLRGSVAESAPIVETLDRALVGIKRASFGGWIKAARAALRLDAEDEYNDATPDKTEWQKVDMVWYHWANSIGDYKV